jgi:hypothetical protein
MSKKGQNDTSFSLGARPLAAINPPFVTADPLGTYGVGVRRDSYTLEGRPLSVNWWYPAMISADSIPFVGSGGVVGKAYPDALLDTSGGPYPLILFSPWSRRAGDTYYFYCANLASYGYIVISITHFDATRVAAGGNLSPVNFDFPPNGFSGRPERLMR